MSTFVESLDKFFESTAWKMTPPPAYGAFHLSFTFIGIAVCIFLAWKLRRLSERGTKPFWGVSAVFSF
jgi:hypothetical protein